MPSVVTATISKRRRNKFTQVRPRSKSKSTQTTGSLKRTTRRGAFRPGAKKAFGIRRAPFVETKRREASHINEINSQTDQRIPVDITLARSANYHPIYLDVFNRMSQGLTDHQVAGQSEYGRYLHQKISIMLPRSGDLESVVPFNIWYVTGWVTVPFARTALSTPALADVTTADVRTHIDNHVEDWFNNRVDKLSFHSDNDNLMITSYRKVVNDKNAQLTINPMENGYGNIDGGYPVIYMSAKWTIERKVYREIGTPPGIDLGETASSVDRQNMYPNQQWLPFACLYTDEEQALEEANPGSSVMLGQNTAYYYTDA